MSKPIRIQRKRTKGFKMPTGSVSVTRPGRWGNPFTVEEEREGLVAAGKERGFLSEKKVLELARHQAVSKFEDMMINPDSHTVMPEIRERFNYMRQNLNNLTGKDLGCFCGLDQECHGDVLLKLANP